jgi:hypothetical protein
MITAILTAITVSGVASVHSFYDMSCCSDRDCHPVTNGGVAETRDGFYVGKKFFRKDEISGVYPSPDRRFHVCFGTPECFDPADCPRWLRCIYVPKEVPTQ